MRGSEASRAKANERKAKEKRHGSAPSPLGSDGLNRGCAILHVAQITLDTNRLHPVGLPGILALLGDSEDGAWEVRLFRGGLGEDGHIAPCPRERQAALAADA